MQFDQIPLFYLDLNDDALIRDIVSGVYGGVPEPHNIQNLFPFGVFTALLYRLAPGFPWFGVLLFGLQLFSLGIILVRALSIARHAKLKGIGVRGAIAGVLICWISVAILMLPHFFFVQYSVTTGLLACAAAFLFATGEKRRHFALGIILTGIAWVIRSEMLLLLLPLILLALLFRYTCEVRASRAENEELPGLADLLRYPFITDHYRHYGLTLVVLALVLAVGWSADRIGYAAQDWNEFVRFFNARTEIYDYAGIPPYEGHEDFYASVGMSAEAVTLLENYNFGLDEGIDATVMEAVAAYADSLLPSIGHRLPAAVGQYIYRVYHVGFPTDYTWPQTDAPWNLVAGLFYLAVILLAWYRTPAEAGTGKRILRAFWQPLLLLICRTGLWLFIIIGGRDPVRITHPLYFVEISLLSGMLFMRLLDARAEVTKEPVRGDTAEKPAQKSLRPLMAGQITALVLMGVIGLLYLMPTAVMIRAEQEKRAVQNAPYEALRRYCVRHYDELYFFDVYSSVRESRPLFDDGHRTGVPDNLDLLGGWAVKSPAWRDKLDRFGLDDAEEGLLQEGIHFIADAESDISWLTDWYASNGRTVTLRETDRIAAGNRSFVVYDAR
ncbi:MAG: hypothetical protein K5696_03730 [Lachnospiraceae bacterium]|nr:hypothetical protein [Lachnospiraceae bacterium]